MFKHMLLVAVMASVTALAAPAHKTAKAAPPNDAQIAHIAVTADQIDIDAAKQALDKSQNEAVKKFAQRMIDDHGSVNQQATALAQKLNLTPQDNPTSQSLKASAEKTHSRLGNLSGAAFDRAYVKNEVAYHKAVLHALDKVLIPNAKNKELKALLKKARPVFVQHLHHAEMLERQLGKATGKMGTMGNK